MIPHVYPQLEPYLRCALAGRPVNAVEVISPSVLTGQEQAFLVSYLPAFDEAGEVVGVSVAAIDITTRKQAEAALRESEDHYRHTVELNPQIPWVLDENGMATMISPRWKKITGMSEEKSRGRGFIDALHPADQQRVVETIEDSLRTCEPMDVQCRARTTGGDWRWIHSRGAPRRGASGKIIGWYGSVDDIDTQKRLEEELRKVAGGH